MPALIILVSTLVLLWAVSRRMAITHPVRRDQRTSDRVNPPRQAPRPLALPALDPPAPVQLSSDEMCARLRDRYIAARFPGIATSAANFADVDSVVTTARLLFEEGRYDDAQEFLQLAIGLSGTPEPLRLAQLEIAFLHRDALRFAALARAFGDAIPGSPAWPEVVRLGHVLAPDDVFFAEGAVERRHDHYGAWPDTPNWIGAPWDLTQDMLAAEFHRAMKDEKGVQA